MTHCITIIEGPGKGRKCVLKPGRTLVGRSKDVDFVLEAGSKGEEERISRSHAEVWLRDDQVYIKDLSRNGTLLQGKPLAKSAQVSMNTGDRIGIGGLILIFETEVPPVEEATVGLGQDEAATQMALEDALDRTTEADLQALAGRHHAGGSTGSGKDNPEGTKVLAVDDGTQVIDEKVWDTGIKNLPQKKEKKSRLAAVVAGGLLLAVLCFFFWRRPVESTQMVLFQNADCSLMYPDNWVLEVRSPSEASIQTGSKTGPDWARITVRVEKGLQHKYAGMSRGFRLLSEEVFKLNGRMEEPQRIEVNNAKVVHFRADVGNSVWRGLFVPHDDLRITVIAECPSAAYATGRSRLFTQILETFQLLDTKPQTYIDYDETQDQEAIRLASVNPSALPRAIHQELSSADAKWNHREVRLDMLYGAVQGYRRAIHLALAPQLPLKEYTLAAGKLYGATQELNARVADRFLSVELARRQGHTAKAIQISEEILGMIPDGNNADNRRARAVLDQLKVANNRR